MCSSEMLQHNWHKDWHKNAQKPIFNSAKPVLCERERNLLTFCLNKRLEVRRRGRSSSRTQESNIEQVWSQTISILSNNSCKERTHRKASAFEEEKVNLDFQICKLLFLNLRKCLTDRSASSCWQSWSAFGGKHFKIVSLLNLFLSKKEHLTC